MLSQATNLIPLLSRPCKWEIGQMQCTGISSILSWWTGKGSPLHLCTKAPKCLHESGYAVFVEIQRARGINKQCNSSEINNVGGCLTPTNCSENTSKWDEDSESSDHQNLVDKVVLQRWQPCPLNGAMNLLHFLCFLTGLFHSNRPGEKNAHPGPNKVTSQLYGILIVSKVFSTSLFIASCVWNDRLVKGSSGGEILKVKQIWRRHSWWR